MLLSLSVCLSVVPAHLGCLWALGASSDLYQRTIRQPNNQWVDWQATANTVALESEVRHDDASFRLPFFKLEQAVRVIRQKRAHEGRLQSLLLACH